MRQTSSRIRPRTIASPIARRIAGVNGVEISVLQGSGPNGRIILRDVPAPASHRLPPSPIVVWRSINTERLHQLVSELGCLGNHLTSEAAVVVAAARACITVPEVTRAAQAGTVNREWRSCPAIAWDSAETGRVLLVRCPSILLVNAEEQLQRKSMELNARTDHSDREYEGADLRIIDLLRLGHQGVVASMGVDSIPTLSISSQGAVANEPGGNDAGPRMMTATLAVGWPKADEGSAARWMSEFAKQLEAPAGLLLEWPDAGSLACGSRGGVETPLTSDSCP